MLYGITNLCSESVSFLPKECHKQNKRMFRMVRQKNSARAERNGITARRGGKCLLWFSFSPWMLPFSFSSYLTRFIPHLFAAFSKIIRNIFAWYNLGGQSLLRYRTSTMTAFSSPGLLTTAENVLLVCDNENTAESFWELLKPRLANVLKKSESISFAEWTQIHT